MNELETKLKILKYLMQKSPFQPATNFWRAIEVYALSAVLPSTGKVLDIGCGDGVLSKILNECITNCTWETTGIDLNKSEIDYAKTLNFYTDLQVCQASKMPFRNASFDFAFSNSVLEHISNLEETIIEIARCLKTSGKLFATVPSNNFHQCLSARAKWIGKDYYAEIDRRLQHKHYLSESEWSNLLGTAGLKLISIEPYLSIRQIQRWEFCSNWTGGLAYKFLNKNKSPLEIQKNFGLKREASKLYFPLLDLVCKIFFESLLEDQPTEISGAYLITAIKI